MQVEPEEFPEIAGWSAGIDLAQRRVERVQAGGIDRVSLRQCHRGDGGQVMYAAL